MQIKEGVTTQEQEDGTTFVSQNYPEHTIKNFSEWKRGIFFGKFVTVLTLLINIGLIIGVYVHRGFIGGNTVLYNGNCTIASRLETRTHVLSASTPNEIDKAHKRGSWLNVGVLSFTNLRRISGLRMLLWAMLGLFSLPLHLLYNSVVYSSITSYEYNGYVDRVYQDALEAQAQCHTWENLTIAECIAAYSQAFLLDRSDVIVVAKASNATNSLYMGILDGNVFLGAGETGDWLCPLGSYGSTCNVADPSKQPNLTDWSVTKYQDIDGDGKLGGVPVDYCLSRPMPDICTMSANLALMIAVIVCNIEKLATMGLVLRACKEEPIVTMGDAVSSFLDGEDPTTTGRSLYTRQDFKKDWQNLPPLAKPYQPRLQFWISSISGGRFWVSLLLCITAGIVVGILLREAIVALTLGVISLSPTASLGFGRINSRAYWDTSPTTFYSNVIIANVPQVLFSLLYISYNGLYTNMHLGTEWVSYFSERKPLRVTNPRGTQLSTYWLQLPYTSGVPPILSSACMHWLISQSFFLEIVYFPSTSDELAVTCGYSVLPIVVMLALGGVMLILMLVNAFRWRTTGMPVVDTSSAAISAACHPQDGTDSTLPLK